MNSRNDAIGIASIIVLAWSGVGYANGFGVGSLGQEARSSPPVGEAAGKQGAQAGGAASSGQSRQEDGRAPAEPRIDPKVYTELEKSSDGTAYVAITLRPATQETPAPEQGKALVKNVQDKVLAKMLPAGFDLVHRFETAALLIGRIDAAGLALLRTEPDVVGVAPSKVDTGVYSGLRDSQGGMVHVFVNLTPVTQGAPTSAQRKALVKQIQDRVLLELKPGEFEIEWQYSLIAGMSGHINAAGLAKLEAHPDVVSVGVVPTLEYQLDTSIPFMRADQVHGLGYTGADVTVAVLDSGVDCSHIELIGRCAPGAASFVGGQSSPGAEDDHGHGTYMAAIIAGNHPGVAPDAHILPIKIATSAGPEMPALIAGILHVTSVKDAYPNLRVMNISVGTPTVFAACPPCDTVPSLTQLASALSLAEAAGIVTFAVSVNGANCGMISAPACVSSAVAVAGVYDYTIPFPGVDYGICQDLAPQPHLVMCPSNRATVDCNQLGAPGYDILIDQPPPGIGTWGTSHATAHASGVAALMIQKGGCPGLSPDQIAQILDATGTELTVMGMSCPGDEVPSSIDALDAINFFSGSCSAVGHPACNGDVTLIDFGIFMECMQGPGGSILPGSCTCVDYPEGGRQDADGDVDLRDFAAFQRDFTGWSDGACCHIDGSCTDGPPPECFASDGVYQGNGTTCATVECPLPNWGACCDIAAETCSESTEEDCVWGGGFYLGGGTACATADCPTARYHNVIDPLTTYITPGPGLRLGDDITLSGTGPFALAFYDLGVFGGGGGTFSVTVGLYTNCPGAGGTLIPGTERIFSNNPDNGSPVFLQGVFNPPVVIPKNLWMVTTFSNSQAGWFLAQQAEIGYTANLFGRYDPPWVCNYWFGGSPYAGFWGSIGCVEP